MKFFLFAIILALSVAYISAQVQNFGDTTGNAFLYRVTQVDPAGPDEVITRSFEYQGVILSLLKIHSGIESQFSWITASPSRDSSYKLQWDG